MSEADLSKGDALPEINRPGVSIFLAIAAGVLIVGGLFEMVVASTNTRVRVAP